MAAARELFARDGFAGVSTREVVEATGLTRGALYHHFPDKHALFDAVVELVAQEVVVRIDEAAAAAPSSFEALRQGCRVWLDAMAEPRLHRLYLIDGPAVLGVPRWREIDNAHCAGTLREGLAAFVGEGSEGAPSDLDVSPFVALISGALNEAALWVAEAGDVAEARSRAVRAVDLLLKRLFLR